MMLGDALKDLLKKKQSGQKIEAPREREPSKVVNLTRNYDSVPSLDVLAARQISIFLSSALSSGLLAPLFSSSSGGRSLGLGCR